MTSIEQTEHVIGPPGTGKTETLMTRLEEHLGSGVSPGRIGYSTFTRAAVYEAIHRAGEKFQLSRDDLPYFATMHALCYRALGMDKEQLFTPKHWREFADSLELPYSEEPKNGDIESFEPFEVAGNQEGDVLRSWYDWCRNSELSVEESLRVFDPPLHVNWSPSRALWFAREYEAFKREHRLLDFCDLLLETRRRRWCPDLDVLVFDETQDLSPLQRSLFSMWAERTPCIHMGYDEDQCIYGFQGADPGWLMRFPGRRLFLRQSYRVPARPAGLAQRLISRNRQRYAKDWVPRGEPGEVHFDVCLEQLADEIAQTGKTWYLLARNNFYLPVYTSFLQKEGIPYVNLRGHSPLAKVPGSITAALRLAAGLNVTWDELRLLANDTPSDPYWHHGAKAQIKRLAKERAGEELTLRDVAQTTGATSELLRLLNDPERCLDPIKKASATKSYYYRVVSRYGIKALTAKPHVVVGSCHSVKGGQADNVVIVPDMSRRTFEGYEEDPEPERRVWYVAVTRTRERVFVLEPSQYNFFDEW